LVTCCRTPIRYTRCRSWLVVVHWMDAVAALEDRNIVKRSQLEAEMAMALGGRTAEEVVLASRRRAPPTTSRADRDRPFDGDAIRHERRTWPPTAGSERDDMFLGRTTGRSNVSARSPARSMVRSASSSTLLTPPPRPSAPAIGARWMPWPMLLIERETLDSSDLNEIWGSLPSWEGHQTGLLDATLSDNDTQRPRCAQMGRSFQKKMLVEPS